jgi:hypothetical protein
VGVSGARRRLLVGVKEFDVASVPGSLNLGRFTGRLKIQVFREFPDLRT